MIENNLQKILTTQQLWFFAGIVIFLFLLMFFNLLVYFLVLTAAAILVYLSILIFKLLIIIPPANNGFIKTKLADFSKIPKRKLPKVTVLVPLYKEVKVVKNLVKSLLKQNYPKGKLEIFLLLENDDKDTIDEVCAIELPANFEVIICNSNPRTKPAALNVGLAKAKGDFLVIYDAEDRPQKSQILAAVTTLSNLRSDVVCLQAAINFWNKDTNLLTKFFTAEYLNHYQIFLPALCKLGLPVPLGGTSNFFRTKVLKKLGGWDSFNVTEDADLGVRIARAGFKVIMLESITWEEANSSILNWIRQRSRWIKGYLQTYLAHMRNPVKLYSDLGFVKFISFQLILGAGPFSTLFNPIFWLMTGVYIATRSQLIEMIFPAPMFYLGLICTLGNFIFVFFKMSACMKSKQFNKVPLMIFAPIYWILMSFGAFYGLAQLIFKPYYWEKTQHGLEIEKPVYWWAR